jgi:PhzF family phenazine biosynthesis protein
MGIPCFQVDAFTATPFAGNPAAVCLLSEPRDEGWMQQVAREMNLSETAFLLPEGDAHRLRWFTPVAEVELCGHATLASAHVLWSEGILGATQQARFLTLSGLLTADRRDGKIELDFPLRQQYETEPVSGLADALGVEIAYSGREKEDLLLLVDSEHTLRGIEPDFATLRRLELRGVAVTAPSANPEFDFVSRFFAPAMGVDEDPVTGSAHCYLGPFWSARLGKDKLRALQASPRGGVLEVRIAGDRVRLGGQAVTVLRGEFVV